MTRIDTVSAGPTLPGQRIQSLDALRGFALFGILAFNITMLGLVNNEFGNPLALGPLSWSNHLSVFLVYVFVSGKFFRLFAMLFGAGICMMTQRISDRGKNPAPRHYSRMFWLFMIGFGHAVLISTNDILKLYALVGLVAYLFRKIPPKFLLTLGLLIIAGNTVNHTFFPPSLPQQHLEARKELWHPAPASVDRDIEAHEAFTWLTSLQLRFRFQTDLTRRYDPLRLLNSLLGCLPLMLIGMALFKWGIFSGRASNRLYRKLLFWGLGLGILLSFSGWLTSYIHDWDFFLYNKKYYQDPAPLINALKGFFSTCCVIGVCLGYISGVTLLCKSGKLKRFFNGLAALGRMALTNYLLQNLVCAFIFFGYGLSLYGKIDRAGLFLLTLGITALQMVISSLWLKHFSFGPVEWLWRSLTYWKLQPMRIKKSKL